MYGTDAIIQLDFSFSNLRSSLMPNCRRHRATESLALQSPIIVLLCPRELARSVLRRYPWCWTFYIQVPDRRRDHSRPPLFQCHPSRCANIQRTQRLATFLSPYDVGSGWGRQREGDGGRERGRRLRCRRGAAIVR